MAQTYYLINTTKGLYLNPHVFGDGPKLNEFMSGSFGSLAALAALLTDGDAEFDSDSELFGSWAGDAIVFASDHGQPGSLIPEDDLEADEEAQAAAGKPYETPNLYDLAKRRYEDISKDLLLALCQDEYHRGVLRERLRRWSRDLVDPEIVRALGL